MNKKILSLCIIGLINCGKNSNNSLKIQKIHSLERLERQEMQRLERQEMQRLERQEMQRLERQRQRQEMQRLERQRLERQRQRQRQEQEMQRLESRSMMDILNSMMPAGRQDERMQEIRELGDLNDLNDLLENGKLDQLYELFHSYNFNFLKSSNEERLSLLNNLEFLSDLYILLRRNNVFLDRKNLEENFDSFINRFCTKWYEDRWSLIYWPLSYDQNNNFCQNIQKNLSALILYLEGLNAGKLIIKDIGSFNYYLIKLKNCICDNLRFSKTDKYTEGENEKLHVSKEEREEIIRLFNEVIKSIEEYNSYVQSQGKASMPTDILDDIARRLDIFKTDEIESSDQGATKNFLMILLEKFLKKISTKKK